METPNTPELGLEALTICSEIDQNHHNCCLMTSNPFPPPLSVPSYSHISDYIGTESCCDLKNYQQEVSNAGTFQQSQSYRGDHRDQRWELITKKKKDKEYPPPMTLRPFVLKRNSTSDGRLIITKEKVKHHEYLKANRSNGRLTLELVSLVKDDEDEYDETLYSALCFKKENEGIGSNYNSVRSSLCLFDLQALSHTPSQKGKAKLI